MTTPKPQAGESPDTHPLCRIEKTDYVPIHLFRKQGACGHRIGTPIWTIDFPDSETGIDGRPDFKREADEALTNTRSLRTGGPSLGKAAVDKSDNKTIVNPSKYHESPANHRLPHPQHPTSGAIEKSANTSYMLNSAIIKYCISYRSRSRSSTVHHNLPF